MRPTLSQPAGTTAQSPNKPCINLFHMTFMVVPAGYQAASKRRSLLIGYRLYNSNFPGVWTASAAVPGSIIGCYPRRVERHRRLPAREYHDIFNRPPVIA